MRKAITVVVLIVVLFVFFAGAWAGYQKLKKAYYIPKVEEINMSEKIDKECFGLFIMRATVQGRFWNLI